MLEKTCYKCNLTKPIEDFAKANRLTTGRLNMCKECVKDYYNAPKYREYRRQYAKNLYTTNPGKVKEANRKAREKRNTKDPWFNKAISFIANSLRRETRRQGVEMVLEIFNRDKRTCLACGSVENITIDHIVPVSKGGRTELSNLQLLCHTCNLKKMTAETDYRVQGT